MALQGTLETFALPDVLRLLASTKKTGAYRLDGNRGSGCLWVSEGQIVGGELVGSAVSDPTEIAFELLRFSDGDFVFDADATAPEPLDGLDVETVLTDAEKLLEEWKDVEAVVPSLDHGVALQPELPGDEVTIRADIWLFVVGIGGGTTVGRLGHRLGLGELGISRIVKQMLELGIVELTEPGAAPEPEPEPEVEVEVEEAFATEAEGAFGSFSDGLLVDDVPAADEPFEPFDPNALVIEDPFGAAEEPSGSAPFGGLSAPETLLVSEPEPEPEPEPAADTASDPTDAAEIARQLANLSPKAAKAVAAAAKATTQEEREAALAEVDETEDPINRELLLKFLGSVNS